MDSVTTYPSEPAGGIRWSQSVSLLELRPGASTDSRKRAFILRDRVFRGSFCQGAEVYFTARRFMNSFGAAVGPTSVAKV